MNSKIYVDDEALKLGPNALRLLVLFKKITLKSFHISYDEITSELGLSRNTTSRALKELVKASYVNITQKTYANVKVNVYEVLK